MPWKTELRKHCYNLCQRTFLSMFSSRNFMLSCLIFKSLNHFELISVYSIKEYYNFSVYICLSNFPNIICWRDFLSIIYSYLQYQRLIDCRCVSLFLVPVSHMSVFVDLGLIFFQLLWTSVFFFMILFSFGCTGSSLSHRLFSSCSEWGLLSSCGARAQLLCDV